MSAKRPASTTRNITTAFSSTFVDVNNDGKVDLLVANDSSSNYLYINKGDGTFEDASYYSGFALNQDRRAKRRRWAWALEIT